MRKTPYKPLRLTVTIDYEGYEEHYGTSDAEKMAAIDEKNFNEEVPFGYLFNQLFRDEIKNGDYNITVTPLRTADE